MPSNDTQAVATLRTDFESQFRPHNIGTIERAADGRYKDEQTRLCWYFFVRGASAQASNTRAFIDLRMPPT